MIGAIIQIPCRKKMRQQSRRRHGVMRLIQIGGMALFALHREPGRHRPAPPDLDLIADFCGAGGFADQTIGHPFALRIHPIQNGDCAVKGGAFFVAGDGDDNGAIRRGVLHEITCRRHKGRHTRFHISRPAPIKPIAIYTRRKGRIRPGRHITGGHNIGMTIKAKTARSPFFAPSGV